MYAPRLIDEYLPEYDVVERHRTAIRASRERVYEAVRELDMTRSPVIRGLFALRGLPALLARSSARRVGSLGLTLDGLLDTGFVLLGERPGEELLLGLVGRFWTPTGDLVRVEAKDFRDFRQPGYARAVWNFSLSESEAGATLLATETRVRCLDSASRRRFRLYWTVVGPFSGLIRREILRSIKRDVEALTAGQTRLPGEKGVDGRDN